jgi:hypothetical protein
MITKETAREIYNCYQQIEEIDNLKADIADEIRKVRERKERNRDEPLPNNHFGKYGHGLQLGIPDGISSSMRIFDIDPTIGICVIDAQRENLMKRLGELEAIVKIEMSHKTTKQ